MTLQSALTRNTLNQRASRARRKDYIQALEQRLHDYEAHGVQATAEIQAAARKVAAENAALREEVGMLRERCTVLEEKISVLTRGGVLGSKDGGVDGLGSGRRRRNGNGRGGARKKVVAGQPGSGQRSIVSLQGDEEVICRANSEQQGIPRSSFMPSPGQDTPSTISHGIELSATRHAPPVEEVPSPWPPENTPSDLEFSSPPPSFENKTYKTQYPTPPIFSQPRSHSPIHIRSPPPCSAALAPNSTPCLQAALIIASMRGIPPDEHTIEARILPELGCLGPAQRPRCISSGACRSHDYENSRGLRDSGGTAVLDCAVDNGRLFGILAREE